MTDPGTSTDSKLDVRLMEPTDRTLAAMILADATPEGSEEAASKVIAEHEASEGSAVFLVYLNGMPIAAYILAPAQMSVEMPLLAVREEVRRKGIGKIIMQDALRRAGNRPVVAEVSEEVMPFFSAVGFKKFGRRKGPNGEPRYRVGWHTPGMRTPTGQADQSQSS